MKKRVVSLMLVFCMMLALFPNVSLAAGTYKYWWSVKTADKADAGTDAILGLGYNYYTAGNETARIDAGDSGGKIYEQNYRDNAYFYFSKDDPWMIKDVYAEIKENKGTGPGWCLDGVEAYVAYMDDTSQYRKIGYFDFEEVWVKIGEPQSVSAGDAFKRTIKSYGNYDKWTSTEYVGVGDSGKITKTWNGMVVDNYCLNTGYNSLTKSDPPTITATYDSKYASAVTSDLTATGGSSRTFSIDKALLNELMTGVSQATFTFNLTFPSQSTTNYAAKTQILTVKRRTFDLSGLSVKGSTFDVKTSGSYKDCYYNEDYRDFSVELSPSEIYGTTIQIGSADSAKIAKALYESRDFIAELHTVEKSPRKVCDLVKTLSGSTIKFSGIIPDGFTSKDYGLEVRLKGVTVDHTEGKYVRPDGTTTRNYRVGSMYNTYKIDNIKPEIKILDINGNPQDISGKYANSQKFWATSSETMYDVYTASKRVVKKFKYSLKAVGSDILVPITEYSGIGRGTTIIAPINTSVLPIIPINLKLATENEGVFVLSASGYDIAGNIGETTVQNVLLDNQAPRVAIWQNNENQGVDGSKISTFRFDITDFANTARATPGITNAWARTYYCFTKKGELPPAINSGEVESGELDTTLGKWAFVEGGENAGTALFKVLQDEVFEGTIHYYTEDSAGNTSTKSSAGNYYTREFSIKNRDPQDTLISEAVDYPKSSYMISFGTGVSGTMSTQYRWVPKDPASTFVQEYMWPLGGVGDKEQADKNGNIVTMDGIFELEYKVTETDSGNYKVYRKEYIFDNKGPEITRKWAGDNLKPQKTQQLSISAGDISGVMSGQYKLVNPDGSQIGDGLWQDLTIEMGPDTLNIIDETLTFSQAENGVYGVQVSATDNNNYKSVIAQDDIGTYAIRNEKPVIDSIIHNLEKEYNGMGVTGGEYSLSLDITEAMKNAQSLGRNQVVKYAISADGTSYDSWKTVEGAMTKDVDKLSTKILLENPLLLSEGMNTVYVKVACMEEGDTSDPDESLVSQAASISIILDISAPNIKSITYDELNATDKDIVATVIVEDVISAQTNIESSDPNIIATKVDDATYTVTIKENVDTNLQIFDMVGNSIDLPIKVRNIDRTAPVLSAEVLEHMSGGRKDAKITVKVVDMSLRDVAFALAPGGASAVNEEDYQSFRAASTFTVEKSLPQPVDGILYETTYTIWAKGLSGDFVLGAKAVDTWGFESEDVIAGSDFTISDLATEVAGVECDPKVSKTTSVATVTFNTPVELKLDGEKDLLSANYYSASVSDFSLTKSFTIDSEKPFDIEVRDECGREYILTVTPDVKFIEGFKLNTSFFKNDQPIKNGDFTAFVEGDNISVVIEENGEYQAQKFFLDLEKLGDFTFNAEKSVICQADETAYSKLVLDAVHDGKTIKEVRFTSYTEEGNEQDRLQDEYIALSTIDETVPTYSMSFSKIEPTNGDVVANISIADTQSGILKLEKLVDGAYQDVDISLSWSVTFSQNGTESYRVTNKAGMTREFDVTVGNIDKDSIQEGVHYNIVYYAQDYNGNWNKAQEGKAYKSVKAVVEPIEGSSKVITAVNNNFELSKILVRDNNIFALQIKDVSGNTKEVRLEYDLFDTNVGTTDWSLSDTGKTNKDITAFVTIKDDENDIAFAQIKLGEKVYPWTGEPKDGVYEAQIDSSGVYTITAIDNAGNKWETSMAVNNIDKVTPKLNRVIYSTPTDKITGKSVRVDIAEFSKPNVAITRVSPEGSLTNEDISVSLNNSTVGMPTIRFKKNGTVSVFFKDDYGNEGAQPISVSNIYAEPPTLKTKATMDDDQLSVDVSFEQIIGEDMLPLDKYRQLSDLFVSHKGFTYAADKAKFTFRDNGVYTFSVFDSAGASQQIELTVTDIDHSAPKITQISWTYGYKQEGEIGEWTRQTTTETLIIGKDTSGKEAGYIVGEDKYHVTNEDVNVTITTDKPTSPVGSTKGYTLDASMLYQENGMYIFNQRAKNQTTASYAVDMEIIDKVAPVIMLPTPELVFIEGMEKDPDYAYDKSKLMDFAAYDLKRGVKHDLTSKVIMEYGNGFNPDDITQNVFDKSIPYYVDYKVYDEAGNFTTVRRRIRLIGFYDSIALVNGVLPDYTNTASVAGGDVTITIKNFAGTAYARFEPGTHTMGQMKNIGTVLTEKDGAFVLPTLTEGWYTVYIQTDKRDYFNISIFYNPNK